MKVSFSALSFLLPAVMLFIGCSTTTESDHMLGETLIVDQSSWSEEQRELDHDFREYLKSGLLRPGTLAAGGSERLTREATAKAEAQQELERRFERLLRNSDDPEVLAWANFRVGQLYFDFSCRMANLDTPTNLSEEQQEMYRLSILDLSLPLATRSVAFFENAVQTDVEPWTTAGRRLTAELSRFSEESEEICNSLDEFWHPAMTRGGI